MGAGGAGNSLQSKRRMGFSEGVRKEPKECVLESCNQSCSGKEGGVRNKR